MNQYKIQINQLMYKYYTYIYMRKNTTYSNINTNTNTNIKPKSQSQKPFDFRKSPKNCCTVRNHFLVHRFISFQKITLYANIDLHIR